MVQLVLADHDEGVTTKGGGTCSSIGGNRGAYRCLALFVEKEAVL